MDEPIEKLILAIFQKSRVTTVRELSHNLGLTKPDIHYHLQKMLQNEMIEIIKEGEPSIRSRGRPEKKYKLTGKKTANNFSELCDLLLSQPLTPQKNEGLLNYLAKKMIPSNNLVMNLTRRLNLLMGELNKRAYFARWEAHKSGPYIMFSSCPYLTIVEKHPELCLLDALIISNYLNSSVMQISKIDISLISPSECVFMLEAAGNSPKKISKPF